MLILCFFKKLIKNPLEVIALINTNSNIHNNNYRGKVFMYIIQQVLLFLGGISLFLLGLKFMSENMEMLTGKKMKKVLSSCTKNRAMGVLTGAFSTAVLQSSVATNVILIGFVSSGMVSFFSACAVIMGTNIGTTVTAQLVALSNSSIFDVTVLGAIMVFVGFILGFIHKNNCLEIGNVLMGFGMLFFGLDVVSECIGVFKSYEAFTRIFLVDNVILLFLNGILITAIVQSSSAVTSVMVVLGLNGLLSFENAMFLIMGANIGTCFPVIWASLSKTLDARRTAVFNLCFNLFGSLVLFLPLCLFKSQISALFLSFSGTIERQIANFHTLFNIFVTLVLFPVLKPFSNLVCKLVGDKKIKKEKNITISGVKIQKI